MSDNYVKTRLLQKTDTAKNWSNHNPILKQGEIGYESDTHKVKIGDGKNHWSDLSYVISNNAEEHYQEIISRGENLVINGNGFLGNNTNFSSLIFDGSNANGSPGSFTLQSGKSITAYSNNFFPINPSATYEFEVDFKCVGNCQMYDFLAFYDVDKLEITAGMHMYIKNTLTKLAKDLKKGDTEVYFESLAYWDPKYKYGHRMIVWDYVNSFGYQYPANTYSRHRYQLYEQTDGKIPSPAVHKETNSITLAKPWAGPVLAKGTEISQGADGGTFKYGWSGHPGNSWETHIARYNGTDYSGGNDSSKFSPGTAYAKVGFLWNYAGKDPTAKAWVTNINVREIRNVALTSEKVKNPLIINSGNSSITFDGSKKTTIAVSSSTASKVTSAGTPTAINFSYDENNKKLTIATIAGKAPTISNVNVVGGISKADIITLEEPVDTSNDGPILEEGGNN